MPLPAPDPAAAGEAHQRWTLADIPWTAIDHDAMRDNEAMFYLVATASFMEATTDLYTQNLIDHFRGDEEVTTWLADHWLPEELQHGRALRRYVETAWPDFAWEERYRPFVDEFQTYCKRELLEPARGLEMASRCVVEMGTASYYTTLSRASPDRVLALLARRIAEDEVRHYKHFYRYFRKYREADRVPRRAVAPALWRRLRMTDGQDSFVVLKHVYAARHSNAAFDTAVYRGLRRQCRQLIGRHFPHAMSVRMLLKPLGLGARAQRIAVPVLETLARRLVP
ncbi:MAG TPA: ferritin-like domain-containing protein [Stellaceae bacterium]|nr:ferritin-like domain-containing protein [Stellaceae bacterium]